MKKNAPKLLIAVLAFLVALGTAAGSTFAWFSMNNRVAVTGMNFTTRTQNSILIAACETTTTKLTENPFQKTLTQSVYALLEPVSTVNGVNFFYNDHSNVANNGSAISNTYIAYDPNDTSDFEEAYDQATGAVGYVDYAFQIKANNTRETTSYVNLTKCLLTYNGVSTDIAAFRIAVFVWDMGEDGKTAAGVPSAASLKSILRMEEAQYFGVYVPATETTPAYYDHTTIAASSTSQRTAVSNLDEAVTVGTLASGSNGYYKVVVRLWLEGEDVTCTDNTFASLVDEWALDLEFAFQSVEAAFDNIND